MDSQQFDAGREGARRLHRVLSLYCALFCWKNRVDAVLLPKSMLYKILGVTRIKGTRKDWLEEDVKDYFEFYFAHEVKGTEYFVFSRESLDDIRESKSFKILNDSLDIISQLELSSELGLPVESEAFKMIVDKLSFLQGTTTSTSHLMGLQMSSLASGVISINDMFKS